ncbi:MAG: YebC/PmpR family DNA-binding transcriptional regulator [Planctomycetes bacterium]|nr:YebC/PmpR family DNA-binding transcriptional regulator [Planctomycetota bacterium]
MGRAYQNRKDAIAKTSDKKAKVYSKYGREIYVCAKSGDPDPDLNATLRALIERARRDQVPTHVIDRAIEKAKGGGGEDFAQARYEGYGPNGTMLIVECLTDNPTRTFNEVRTAFGKAKAKLGNAGAVAHMFDHCAVFVFPADDEDAVLEALLTADVDVIDVESEGGMVTVLAKNTQYGEAKKAIVDAFDGVEFEVDEIQFVPQNTTALTGEDAEMFEKLVDALEDLDDVQKVFHSAEV